MFPKVPLMKRIARIIHKNKKNKNFLHKINSVSLAHIDPNYPEIPIVINSKAYDYELENLLKKNFLTKKIHLQLQKEN